MSLLYIKVFAAEKIMAAGGAFHTSCFTCYCCHKPLEITSVYENQGEIYCKSNKLLVFLLSDTNSTENCLLFQLVILSFLAFRDMDLVQLYSLVDYH